MCRSEELNEQRCFTCETCSSQYPRNDRRGVIKRILIRIAVFLFSGLLTTSIYYGIKEIIDLDIDERLVGSWITSNHEYSYKIKENEMLIVDSRTGAYNTVDYRVDNGTMRITFTSEGKRATYKAKYYFLISKDGNEVLYIVDDLCDITELYRID